MLSTLKLQNSEKNEKNKILKNHKFFLDLKNYSTQTDLESKIKELGGEIELFLESHVTYVITDKEHIGKSPLTVGDCRASLNSNSNSLHSNESSYNNIESPSLRCSQNFKKNKSRANAMLEKVIDQRNSESIDVLEKAKNWKIPIWSVQKILNWIEIHKKQIEESNPRKDLIKETLNKKKIKFSNSTKLKSPYIKFEPLNKQRRPIIKQLKSWPRLNLSLVSKNKSIFDIETLELNKKVIDSNKSNSSVMMLRNKRKSIIASNKKLKNHSGNFQNGGYCEICKVEYNDLGKHVDSQMHVDFIKNETNFLSLDKLIESSANINSFLNGAKSNHSPDQLRRSSPRSNGLQKINGDIKLLNCTRSGNKYLLDYSDDKKQKSNKTKKYDGSDDSDDEKPLIKHVKKLVKTKRKSSDDRLVSDNKLYYKVEILNSKLRSKTAKENNSRQNSGQNSTRSSLSPNKCPNSLVFKFKRIRQSELSQLNDEAENFMFPKQRNEKSPEKINSKFNNDVEINKDTKNNLTDCLDLKNKNNCDNYDSDSSCDIKKRKRKTITKKNQFNYGDSDSDSSLDDITKKRKYKNQKKEKYISNKINHQHNNKSDSECSQTSSENKRKKRRTHAEAFIFDNEKYYKFETCDSRLRFHGSFLPIMSYVDDKNVKIKEETKLLNIKQENDVKSQNMSSFLDSYTYAYESKKYNYKEKLTELIESDFKCYVQLISNENLFVKPYGVVGVLDSKTCRSNFEKKYLNVKNVENDDENKDDKNVCKNQDQLQVEQKTNLQKTRNSKNVDVVDKKTKVDSKLVLISPSKNPRKSPRKHASTLAILSGLLQNKKRRSESDKLNTIVEENEGESETNSESETESEDNFDFECEIEADESLMSLKLEDNIIDMKHVLNSKEICFNLDTIIPENLHKLRTWKCGRLPKKLKVLKKKLQTKKINKTGWPKKLRKKLVTKPEKHLKKFNKEETTTAAINVKPPKNLLKKKMIKKKKLVKKKVKKRTKSESLKTKLRSSSSSISDNLEYKSEVSESSDRILPNKLRSTETRYASTSDYSMNLRMKETRVSYRSSETPTVSDDSDTNYQPFVKVQKVDVKNKKKRLKKTKIKSSKVLNKKIKKKRKWKDR